MRFRKTLLILLILLFSLVLNDAVRAEQRTLQAFGVQVKHGQPVYPLPTNVTLGLFNPDPLLDLAYYADGKIQVWQNLGDGTFGGSPVFEQRVSDTLIKMEFRKSRMWTETIFDKDSWGDLVLTYVNGATEKISHEWMNSVNKSFALLPQMTTGFPQLNFTEKWRSDRNGEAGSQVEVGDIDNDGKTELVYMFYPPVGQTLGRLAVYECVGNDSYVLDWDTTVATLAGVFCISDLDNDGHKEIVTAYFPRGIGILPRVALLECFGPMKYRFYDTNIGFQAPIFKVQQTDADHDGVKELTVLTSDLNAVLDPTIIYVAEFTGKSQCPSCPQGWLMSFSGQIARYQAYTFNLAVGQVDGQGWDEIIPAGGSFGFHEPAPVDYLWYSGVPGPQLWRRREIYTGLESGTGAVMFANLDADTMQEFISGAPGPIGHGSMFALKYLHDTTWSVMWTDSSLRNAPLWVNTGMLSGRSVVAGANTRSDPPPDSFYTQLNVYEFGGTKVGFWHQVLMSIQQFHFIDIDHDQYTDLIFARLTHLLPGGHLLVVYETDSTTAVRMNPIPVQFGLHQNYPNPFNPVTTIGFTLAQSSYVGLTIFNILGKEVKALVKTHLQEGTHDVEWNGTNNEGGDVGSGVYLYRIVITNAKGATCAATKKMILIR